MKKIALFDLVWIVLFLLLGILIFVFLIRKDKYINIVVKITNDNVLYSEVNPPNWFVNLFRKGMLEKDGLGRISVEIKDIYVYDMQPTRKAVYLQLNLKATINKKTGQYSYKGKPLLVGSPIKIQFEKILVNGLVVSVEGLNDSWQSKIITLETQLINYQNTFPNTRGVEDYVAQALNVGEKVKFYDGSTLITISAKKIEPAKRIITTASGQTYLGQDPLMKDVFLTLKVKAKIVNNEYYLFDDVRIKVGQGIPLNLENITVWPTITGIVSIKDNDEDLK